MMFCSKMEENPFQFQTTSCIILLLVYLIKTLHRPEFWLKNKRRWDPKELPTISVPSLSCNNYDMICYDLCHVRFYGNPWPEVKQNMIQGFNIYPNWLPFGWMGSHLTWSWPRSAWSFDLEITYNTIPRVNIICC